jgi:hypothetical protein
MNALREETELFQVNLTVYIPRFGGEAQNYGIGGNQFEVQGQNLLYETIFLH